MIGLEPTTQEPTTTGQRYDLWSGELVSAAVAMLAVALAGVSELQELVGGLGHILNLGVNRLLAHDVYDYYLCHRFSQGLGARD